MKEKGVWTTWLHIYTGGLRKTGLDSRPVQKGRPDKMNNVISKDIE